MYDKPRFDLRYEDALAAVLLTANPSLAKLDALEKAATDWAITVDGENRIVADIETAERTHQLERAALLRSALNRGRVRREAARQVREMIAAPEPAPQVPAGMRAWSPAEPIWPKADVTDAALRYAALTEANRDAIYRAYRAVYSTIWRSTFTDKNGAAAFPSSDAEGWAWRKQVIAKAQKTITGATTLAVCDLKPGMVIVDQGTLKQVAELRPGLPMRIVTPDNQVLMSDAFYLVFSSGAEAGPVKASAVFARVPALEGTGLL